MFDNIQSLFHQDVVAAFEDHLSSLDTPSTGRNRDIRLGLNAAKSLYHLREHLPAQHARTREQVESACADYALLADVVDASKHGTLRNRHRQILAASDISETVVITELRDEAGEYRHVEKEITVHLQDGTRRSLHEILTAVMNYWIGELFIAGVINQRPLYAARTWSTPPTREQCGGVEDGAGKLDIEIVRGLPFRQDIRVQQFNYATGKIEPRDLTGMSARMRIARPRYSVDLSIRSPSGKSLERTVHLTSDEAAALHRCDTEEQKQSFLRNSTTVRTALTELLRTARDEEAANSPEPD